MDEALAPSSPRRAAAKDERAARNSTLGMLTAGFFAFVVTTGSSFMLSGTSNVAYDLFARFAGDKIGERGTLVVRRTSVVAIALVVIVLGPHLPTALDPQMYSCTVHGADITPAVLAVLSWKRATTTGAVAPGDFNGVIVALPAAVPAPDARTPEATGVD